MKNFATIQKRATKFMDKVLGSGAETTIIYKMFISSNFNDTTGTREDIFQEYEIKSIKVDATLHAQIGTSVLAGASFGAGQINYLIKQEDMPRSDAYHPDILKDFIDDNGNEKQVKVAVPLLKTFVKVQV